VGTLETDRAFISNIDSDSEKSRERAGHHRQPGGEFMASVISIDSTGFQQGVTGTIHLVQKIGQVIKRSGVCTVKIFPPAKGRATVRNVS